MAADCRLSVLLKPQVNRINIVVSVLYKITIIGSAIGDDWAYCFLRSLIEAILLVDHWPNRLEMAATPIPACCCGPASAVGASRFPHCL
jgi:hypothetical protein